MHVVSSLIVPSTARSGLTVQVTPQSAGWEYVGFEVYKLSSTEQLSYETAHQEVAVVVVSGIVSFKTAQGKWENVGKRMSVFEQIPPYVLYVPPGDVIEVTANTDAELAFCKAPAKGELPARLITPDQIATEVRGKGNAERYIHNLLPESEQAEALLVVEVFTPEGHWSSYPPHRHDELDLPNQSLLEETYYHKVEPEHGFVVQHVYTDDRSLDELMAVKNDQVVLVPKGYHPVSAPPGYRSYYLNVMAGPVRTWKFYNDKDHEWIFNTWNSDAVKEEK